MGKTVPKGLVGEKGTQDEKKEDLMGTQEKKKPLLGRVIVAKKNSKEVGKISRKLRYREVPGEGCPQERINGETLKNKQRAKPERIKRGKGFLEYS